MNWKAIVFLSVIVGLLIIYGEKKKKLESDRDKGKVVLALNDKFAVLEPSLEEVLGRDKE